MRRIRKTLCLAGGLLLLGAGGVGRPALADASGCEKHRTVASHALDELTWKHLNRIYADSGEGRNDEAFEALQKMLTRANRDRYLQSVLYQALGQVEWSRENYDSSLSYFEQAVTLDVLPDNVHFALMYQMAQLYYMQDQNQPALDLLKLWFCQSPDKSITAHAFALQASIHARRNEFVQSLKSIDVAISMDENAYEQWYQLKLAAEYELALLPQLAVTLEKMVNFWPEQKNYWIQLSQIYFKLGQEEKALAILALAYRRNLLDQPADIAFLANQYRNAGVPYRAAEVMLLAINNNLAEPGRENWTFVAESWYAAQELEKSLLAYERAGAASADGQTDLHRGYILIDLERWPAALLALNDALNKKGLDDRKTGEAYLLRGLTQFNLDHPERARSDWEKATGFANSRESAQQWLNHVREQGRWQGG